LRKKTRATLSAWEGVQDLSWTSNLQLGLFQNTRDRHRTTNGQQVDIKTP